MKVPVTGFVYAQTEKCLCPISLNREMLHKNLSYRSEDRDCSDGVPTKQFLIT